MRPTPLLLDRPAHPKGPCVYFQHSPEIWHDFPELVPGVLTVGGITHDPCVTARTAPFTALAQERLAAGTEAEFPEIQAWRRAFAHMGLKPTGYRCASEALLRRFRKDGSLPAIHPLIDLCNAISLAFATPIAVIDTARVNGGIEVRYADGSERYMTFGGELEHPEAHEVIFADDAGEAHARRWTNRQSGASAVRRATTDVLIVAEAMHEGAAHDIARLLATLSEELNAVWSARPATALLTAASARFAF